jgi:hypothetical protein
MRLMFQAAPTRRRWLQFGLRTMFVVVTVFAVWLGWELKFIRERQAFLSRMEEQGGLTIFAGEEGESGVMYFEGQTPIPFWRRWLGDRAVASPGFPLAPVLSGEWDDQHEDALNKEIDRLFPESKQYRTGINSIPRSPSWHAPRKINLN